MHHDSYATPRHATPRHATPRHASKLFRFFIGLTSLIVFISCSQPGLLNFQSENPPLNTVELAKSPYFNEESIRQYLETFLHVPIHQSKPLAKRLMDKLKLGQRPKSLIVSDSGSFKIQEGIPGCKCFAGGAGLTNQIPQYPHRYSCPNTKVQWVVFPTQELQELVTSGATPHPRDLSQYFDENGNLIKDAQGYPLMPPYFEESSSPWSTANSKNTGTINASPDSYDLAFMENCPQDQDLTAVEFISPVIVGNNYPTVFEPETLAHYPLPLGYASYPIVGTNPSKYFVCNERAYAVSQQTHLGIPNPSPPYPQHILDMKAFLENVFGASNICPIPNPSPTPTNSSEPSPTPTPSVISTPDPCPTGFVCPVCPDGQNCPSTPRISLDISEEILSPANNDGSFDLTTFHVQSSSDAEWILSVEGTNCTWTWTDSGRDKDVIWDGTCNGTPIEDGAYQAKLVLGNLQDQVDVKIDNTPPIIEFEESRLANGRKVIKTIVSEPVVNGFASGLDESDVEIDVPDTTVELVSANVLQVIKEILFSGFTTSSPPQMDDMNLFQIQAQANKSRAQLCGNSDGQVISKDKAKNESTKNVIYKPIPKSGTCKSRNKQFEILYAFDFDPRAEDITLVVKNLSHEISVFGDSDIDYGVYSHSINAFTNFNGSKIDLTDFMVTEGGQTRNAVYDPAEISSPNYINMILNDSLTDGMYNGCGSSCHGTKTKQVGTMAPSLMKIPQVAQQKLNYPEALYFIALDLDKFKNQNEIPVDLEFWDNSHKILQTLKFKLIKDGNSCWRQLICG